VPDLPDATPLGELGAAALGLLLKALLALGCLAFAVTGRRELSPECPPALTEAREPSQIPELVDELPGLGGRVVGLPGRVLGVGERVCHVGVAWHGAHHPRGLVTLSPRPLEFCTRLVALDTGPVKPGTLLVAAFAL